MTYPDSPDLRAPPHTQLLDVSRYQQQAAFHPPPNRQPNQLPALVHPENTSGRRVSPRLSQADKDGQDIRGREDTAAQMAALDDYADQWQRPRDDREDDGGEYRPSGQGKYLRVAMCCTYRC